MIDFSSLWEMFNKLIGAEDVLRTKLIDLAPAQTVFKQFIEFGYSELLKSVLEMPMIYVWMIFMGLLYVAFSDMFIGTDTTGLLEDYVERNQGRLALFPEGIVNVGEMSVSSKAMLAFVTNSLFYTFIYVGIAGICAVAAMYFVVDESVLTAFFESFLRNPIMSIIWIVNITVTFATILSLQMFFTIAGAFTIPLVEAGMALKSSFAKGMKRFFLYNLFIPPLTAAAFAISIHYMADNMFMSSVFVSVGQLIPLLAWIGALFKTLVEVFVEILFYALALLGVPVGPLQKAKHLSKTMSGIKAVSAISGKLRRKRPTQMDDTPAEGTI